MSKGKNILLIVLIFAVVLAAAALGYGYLSKEYAPEQQQAKPGDPVEAPDFTVVDKTGAAVKLSDFEGKPTIVNFWATWCGPCKQELPYFDAAYKQYGSRVNFVIINVDGGYETVAGAKKFVSQEGYSFPQYFDVMYNASQIYGVSSIPATMCVSADGYIVWAKIGMVSEAELANIIKSLIGDELK